MFQRKSKKNSQNDFIVPGAFIPQRVQQQHARQSAQVGFRMSALAVLLIAITTIATGSYVGASGRLVPQVQLATSPLVFLTESEPYLTQARASGPITQLTDTKKFTETIAAFRAASTTFIAIDIPEKQVYFFQNGQTIFEAPLQALPSANSWKMAQSGLYTITNKSERQYSALQELYYPNAIQFSRNFVLHGTPEKADGTLAQSSDSGLQLSNSDIRTLYTLVGSDTSVLVRGPENDAVTDVEYVLRGPALAAGSYLVADLASGQTLLSNQAQQSAVSIASLTKLMTALIVAQSYDLEAEVLISQEKYVSTLVPRLEGTARTTNYNLLQLLLIESSNEAAEVLASVMGREEFIKKMNEQARVLGMKDTSFTDPSGLDNGNRSTPADLLLLAQHIYTTQKYIFTLSIEESVVRTVRPDDFVSLDNFNDVPLLNDIVGGKVGETTAAGQTSLTLHKVRIGESDRIVTIIILGSQGRNADVLFLRRYLEDRFN